MGDPKPVPKDAEEIAERIRLKLWGDGMYPTTAEGIIAAEIAKLVEGNQRLQTLYDDLVQDSADWLSERDALKERLAEWKSWHREIVEALGGTVVERKATLALADALLARCHRLLSEVEALEKVEEERDKEKERRIHWQDLCYHAMNAVDSVLGTKTTEDTFKDHCTLLPHHYALGQTARDTLKERLRERDDQVEHLQQTLDEIVVATGSQGCLWSLLPGEIAILKERLSKAEGMVRHREAAYGRGYRDALREAGADVEAETT